jgi:hypothetical protein
MIEHPEISLLRGFDFHRLWVLGTSIISTFFVHLGFILNVYGSIQLSRPVRPVT